MNQKSEVKIINLRVKKNKITVIYQLNQDEIKQIELDEELVVSYRILKDKVFEEKKWEKILSEASLSTNYKKALNFCRFQMRTTNEIKTYLESLSVEPLIILKMVDRLKSMSFLDDERYVTKFIEDYSYNLKGPILIQAKLEQKGIESSFIKEALLNYSEEEQLQNILKIIQKEHLRLISYPVNKQKELITQKLLRAGFMYHHIQKQIEFFTFTSNHQNRLRSDYQKITQSTTDKSKIIQKLLQKGYHYQEIKTLINDNFYDYE